MFWTNENLEWQGPWVPFVFATALLGCALYYLRTRRPPPSSDRQPRQALPDLLDALTKMDPKERAYHERFMREAIAMVSTSHSIKLLLTLLTRHPFRPSLH